MLTAEQHHIVDVVPKSARTLVKAYAGAGKTFTLCAVAQALGPGGLYVAFNKSVQVAAEQRFGPTVRCRTAHALAMAELGPELRAHRGKQIGSIAVHQAAHALGLFGADGAVQAWRARETLSAFLNSADDTVQSRHVPDTLVAMLKARARSQRADIGEVLAAIAHQAQTLWQMAADLENPDLPLPHDGYLHLWAQRQPTLRFRYILFDEAQDGSPIMLRVLLQQKGRLVAVGDPYQELYGFRGAVNALDRIRDSIECRLTEAFRFGAEIAGVANRILQARGEPIPLIGRGAPGELARVDPERPFAVLGRTNSALCLYAVGCCERYPTAVVGGATEMVQLLRAVRALLCDQPHEVKHPLLRQFDNFAELRAFAEETQDAEFGMLVRLADDYGYDLPRIADRLEHDLVPEDRAHITISTVHRAKGREWDQVLLLDDFRDVRDRPPSDRKRCEELNILYVAATRARKRLQLNALLEDWCAGALGGQDDVARPIERPCKAFTVPKSAREI